jgi:hypothetical protein
LAKQPGGEYGTRDDEGKQRDGWFGVEASWVMKDCFTTEFTET